MSRNKIGIVLPFQNGDLITGTSVLKYRDILWPDCDIVWFCNEPHNDALKYQDIETRYFPHGWGILENDFNGIYKDRVLKDKLEGRPEWEDWSILMNEQNRLNPELKNRFKSFSDLHEAYFPAPWMLNSIQRHGLSYPDVSKKIFAIPDSWEWHPVLMFSEEERQAADKFVNDLGDGKNIIIESFAGSSQSKMNESMIATVMSLCNEHWAKCNFIFASHKFLRNNETFPSYLFEQPNVYSCKDFTVRQCALVAEKCDLMISVSSGITVACSAWGIKQPKTIQFCGSWVCSTQSLANGIFELVTADDKTFENAKNEFYEKLKLLLNE